MRHLYANRFGLAAAVTLGVIVASPRAARADVVIFEKDPWSVWTSGRSAAHYQFILGGGTPTPSAPGVVLTGFRNDAATDENNNVATSRIRSGWVGTQLGFGVANQLTPTTKIKAFFAISVADITNDREKTTDKLVDFREAWTTIEGSFGTVKFGRALSIFGPALAGSVYMYSYGNAVGHPCTIDGQAITCGPINAGAIYPGFNAQLSYATPNLNGFGAKIGLFDPSLPSLADGTYPYTLRPLPRVEGELSYEYPLGNKDKVVVFGEGLWQRMGRLDNPMAPTTTLFTDAVGGIAAARFEMAGFRIGGGYWAGKGLGTGVPLQPGQAVDPTGELRTFSGYMAHANYMIGDTELGAGIGKSIVNETDNDRNTPLQSLIKSNTAFHVLAFQHIGPLILGLEFTHWISEWHRGEKQSLNFMGGGVNFLW